MPTAQAKISALRSRLDETLFRDSPAPTPRAQRPAEWAVIAGLFVLAVLLQMLRVGWSASLHSLWAEDGAVYLSGAVHNGFGGSLFDTYANSIEQTWGGARQVTDHDLTGA